MWKSAAPYFSSLPWICFSSNIPWKGSVTIMHKHAFQASVLFFLKHSWCLGFSGGSDGKESTYNAGEQGLNPGLVPWVGKIFQGREWQLTPVFLPGEIHGQRSLVGYRPWCCRVGQDLANKQQFLFYFLPNCLPSTLGESSSRSSTSSSSCDKEHCLCYLYPRDGTLSNKEISSFQWSCPAMQSFIIFTWNCMYHGTIVTQYCLD